MLNNYILEGDEIHSHVKLISEKKQQLDEVNDQVQLQIKCCFERLKQALYSRERQLLRQVEAFIHGQKLDLLNSKIDIIPLKFTLNNDLSGENELKEEILNFGKIDLPEKFNNFGSYVDEEYEEDKKTFNFEKSVKTNEDQIVLFSNIITEKKTNNFIVNKNPSLIIDNSLLNSLNIYNNLTKDLPTLTVKHEVNITSLNQENFINLPDFLKKIKLKPQSNIIFGKKCDKLKNNEFKLKSNNLITPLINENLFKNGKDYPIQIQHWLNQIVAETETEPIIYEIGQFTSNISNTQFYSNFIAET